MKKNFIYSICIILILSSCSPSATKEVGSPDPTVTASTPKPTPSPTPVPTPDPTLSPIQENMQTYLNDLVTESDGAMVYADVPYDQVYNVFFGNSWYLLSKEQKEYIVNNLYTNLLNRYKILSGSDGSISLTIYDVNHKIIAKSKLTGGIELK